MLATLGDDQQMEVGIGQTLIGSGSELQEMVSWRMRRMFSFIIAAMVFDEMPLIIAAIKARYVFFVMVLRFQNMVCILCSLNALCHANFVAKKATSCELCCTSCRRVS